MVISCIRISAADALIGTTAVVVRRPREVVGGSRVVAPTVAAHGGVIQLGIGAVVVGCRVHAATHRFLAEPWSLDAPTVVDVTCGGVRATVSMAPLWLVCAVRS